MHQIHDAVVQDGKIILSKLPFAEGQHVRVTIDEIVAEPDKRLTIQKSREIFRGSVLRFDDPTEPMIPEEDWEMLR